MEHIYRRITIIEEEVSRRTQGLVGSPDVYDPGFDVIKHAVAKGTYSDVNYALNRAGEIAERNPAAGIVAHELVKFGALEADQKWLARDAADRAANLMKRLSGPRY